jgi:hypothetical protein
MKRLTTSLILACANLVLVGLGYLDNWKHISVPEHLPRAISLWPGVISLVVIPFLVLATLSFAIRDLVRPGNRWQGVLALVSAVPIAVIYSTARF